MKLNDIRLNKSGTVGTEPIMKNGKVRTEVKLGKLGSVRLPSKKATEAKLQRFGRYLAGK